jgi:hypothetical protein
VEKKEKEGIKGKGSRDGGRERETQREEKRGLRNWETLGSYK